MFKKLLSLVMLLPILAFSQEFCGNDYIQKELEKKYPEIHFNNNKVNYKHQQKTDRLNKRTTSSTPYNGPIYEVPVVVHVIESTAPENAKWKVTDEEIIDWIDRANKVYATKDNRYFSEAEGGTVMPFKIALAKRTKDGKPTTGIERYNGSVHPDYDRWGVVIALRNAVYQDGTEYQAGKIYQEDIRKIAPHWDESLYFNLYIVVAIDGEKNIGWVGGSAGFPEHPNPFYDAFIKVQMVKDKDNTILPHEFGHVLGLIHPFDAPANWNQDCPPADHDKVDDTQPITLQNIVIKKPDGSIGVPTNNDINPCTNTNYNGTQYNFMAYTYEPRKFTLGQRERATQQMLQYRKSLIIESRGAEPITETSEVNLQEASCKPQRVEFNNNFGTGITYVKLNQINNQTDTRNFYIDYTKNAWRNKTLFTEIKEKEESNITIRTGTNKSQQYIKAWIDYNNNNSFENNELILNQQFSGANKTFSTNFTPPENTIKDTYLRMRVKVDEVFFNIPENSCENPVSGQVEDYAIKIVSEKQPEPVNPSTPVEETVRSAIGINTTTPQNTLDIRKVELNKLPEGQPQGVSFPSFTTEDRNTFDKTKIKQGTMIYNKTQKCIEIFIDGNWNCIK